MGLVAVPEDQAEAIIRLVNARSIEQQLYDSEINFEIAAFWDGGFIVKLGDPLNGYKAEANLATWDEVEPWLFQQALIHAPDKVFAREHGGANVVSLSTEGKKDPEAADRLIHDMGFDLDYPPPGT
jgi:hypothetical protein